MDNKSLGKNSAECKSSAKNKCIGGTGTCVCIWGDCPELKYVFVNQNDKTKDTNLV